MPAKPSAVIDTHVIYCGDNLDQLRKLPEMCVEGRTYQTSVMPKHQGAPTGEMDFMEEWYPIQGSKQPKGAQISTRLKRSSSAKNEN